MHSVYITIPVENESFKDVSWTANIFADGHFEFHINAGVRDEVGIEERVVRLATFEPAERTLVEFAADVPPWVPWPEVHWLDSLGPAYAAQWRRDLRVLKGVVQPELEQIREALLEHVDSVIEHVAGDIALLGSKSEWSMEDNFDTTEGIWGMADTLGLPAGSDLRFYAMAAIQAGYDRDMFGEALGHEGDDDEEVEP